MKMNSLISNILNTRTMLLINSMLKGIRLFFSFLILLGTAVIISSCGSNNGPGVATGEWYKQSDFEGIPRSNAVTFTIDGRPYIGSGFTTPTNSTVGRFLKDFWVYSPDHDSWTAIAPFPGIARSNGTAFAANGKGYFGLGTDGVNFYNDFWEYNPATDKWTRIADFKGSKRYGAASFSINDVGYVGSGLDSIGSTKDFYSYDAGSNTWNQKASVGTKRYKSFLFVIDGKAYIGGGKNNGILDYTFYSYDPSADRWTEEYDLLDDTRDLDPNDKGYTIAHELSSTFVINGLAYVVGGTRVNAPDYQCWQYNPSTRTWLLQTPMLQTYSASRDGAVGFTIGNLGYVATGRNGNIRLDDVWGFDPTQYHVN